MESVKSNALLKEEIDEDDIATIVAKWTGIPVTRMLEGEIQKLVQMPERLKDRVIGQDEAVRLVSNAILRNRAGLERSAAGPSAASSSSGPPASVKPNWSALSRSTCSTTTRP